MYKVIFAYLAAIVAWSTTPIGIKFTSVTLHPMVSLYYRFTATALLGLLVIKVARVAMPWHVTAVKAYLILGFGLGSGLAAAYLGFQTLPSGLGAVIFGLSPIIAALVERMLVPNYKISTSRYFASAVGILGLLIIFVGRNPDLLATDQGALALKYDYVGLLRGSLYLMLSMVLFNIGGVGLRRYVAKHNLMLNPFAISVGGFCLFGLLMGMVLLASSFWSSALHIGPANQTELISEGLGIIYLALVGSIIGFSSYNYLMMRLSVQSAAMVNFVTPVVALGLGVWLNHEVVLLSDYAGTVCVLLSIGLYLFGDQLLVSSKRLRPKFLTAKFG